MICPLPPTLPLFFCDNFTSFLRHFLLPAPHPHTPTIAVSFVVFLFACCRPVSACLRFCKTIFEDLRRNCFKLFDFVAHCEQHSMRCDTIRCSALLYGSTRRDSARPLATNFWPFPLVFVFASRFVCLARCAARMCSRRRESSTRHKQKKKRKK